MTLRTRNSILSPQDYYPYGEIMRSYVQNAANDKHKFTGKERDKESGLGYWLTPRARYYDSEIGLLPLRGRLSVDPLACHRPGLSPYQYCQNNPLALIDPKGMLDEVIAKDEESKELINKALRPEDAKFVKYDKDELNKCNSDDGNPDALKKIVNSADNKFHVVVNFNNKVKEYKRSEGYFFSHDFYGHALIYSQGLPWLHQTPEKRLIDLNKPLVNSINEHHVMTERNLSLWGK